jgi:hypothetical protein
MPTKTGKTYASFYKNDLAVNQSSNTGVDATTRVIHDGAGQSTSISLSDDVLQVQPVNDDGNTLLVKNQGGSNILSVDTSNSLVTAGASQVNVLTMVKEMGLYDFSPTAGYHNPLIANNMMFSSSGSSILENQSMFGNSGDPASTLDLSADGTPKIAVACYWYLENNITLDSVRYMASTDGADTLIFHLESYDLDVSSNHGDLSGGVTHANLNSGIAVTTTNLRTGTLALNEADIDASKVVIGFVESDSINDLTVSFNIKYHIR